MDKHIDKLFKTGKSKKAMEKRMLRTDDFLAPFAVYLQTKKVGANTNRRKVDIIAASTVANCAIKEATERKVSSVQKLSDDKGS